MYLNETKRMRLQTTAKTYFMLESAHKDKPEFELQDSSLGALQYRQKIAQFVAQPCSTERNC